MWGNLKSESFNSFIFILEYMIVSFWQAKTKKRNEDNPIKCTSTFHYFLFLPLILSILLPTPLSAQSTTSKLDEKLRKIEAELLEEVNIYRRGKGLYKLSRDNRLDQIARDHSQNMAEGRSPFSHAGFRGRINQVKRLGFVRFNVGENLYMTAYPYMIAAFAVNNWEKSPSHKEALEGDFQYTGIGIVRSQSKTYYITMVYVAKL